MTDEERIKKALSAYRTADMPGIIAIVCAHIANIERRNDIQRRGWSTATVSNVVEDIEKFIAAKK